jgi:hypothetical protein
MTQIMYRANLGDAAFPLVSTFQGKTVIQPGIDQHYIQQPALSAAEKDMGIPEAYYMHNVMPSEHGYKSIYFNSLIPAITGVSDIKRIFPCKDFTGNRGHIAVTTSGKTWLITVLSPTWKDVTPLGQPTGDVTVANATGSTFICYANWGIYTVNLVSKTLASAALQWDSPITNASITGIGSSNNYLLAHDGSTLYWSSSLSVLDFRASQITGAGKGTPIAVVGKIIALAQVSIGFVIYCQGNIVAAQFSGNVQYPWLFKESPNGSGVASVDHISFTGDDASNYAWTSAGILKVSLSGCQAVHPEVTDFLSGKIFEDFNSTLSTLAVTYLTNNLLVRIAFLSSRFLVVSYGVTELTHALVYDVALKRWGKLKVPHTQAFDLSFRISASAIQAISYLDQGTNTYLDYQNTPYTGFIISASADAPEAKHSIAFVENTGAISTVNFEYSSVVASATDSVLLLGKYQIFRANTLTLQGFTLETIDLGDTTFNTQVLTSYDGKNIGLTTTPYEIIHENLREYKCLASGANHSLLISGNFHLAAAVFTFTKHGNI